MGGRKVINQKIIKRNTLFCHLLGAPGVKYQFGIVVVVVGRLSTRQISIRHLKAGDQLSSNTPRAPPLTSESSRPSHTEAEDRRH